MADESNPIIETSTQDGYDRWSAIYDGEDNPLVALETKHLYELLGEVADLKVLDVGCGTGRHSVELARAGASVTAIDFSAGMLAKAKVKEGAAGIVFRRQDIQARLDFADGAFDRVICCLVLDHIEKLNLLFSEMRRICRPAGEVIVSVMHPAMMLSGARARFTDPETGLVTYPESVPNQVSDYVMAAMKGGLQITAISEHLVDKELIGQSERAGRYLGWPLLLLMKLRP
jgi:ubiquinone/menaquinone biosynthesis C-methylase UbiE